jgi:hypothetical protein
MNVARFLAAAGAALTLAGCAINSNMPNLGLPSLDLFDAPPTTATVTIHSNPTGAEARASNGGTCRTPCALTVPINEGFTITYTLDGYLPETVSVRTIAAPKSALIDQTPPRLEPNPVWAELKPEPVPPPPPPVRKRAAPKG